MTTIAWDGKTLAADKMGTNSGYGFTVTKIFRHKGELLFFSGDMDAGLVMMEWYKAGANASEWPALQSDKDAWSGFHVIRHDGGLWKYERGHVPFWIEDKMYACGSGRDYALGAMACGKTAEQAVEIACRFDVCSGNGIDTLRLL